MFTPSHPPYAYMIRNAIEALGSNSGAKSISEYIKAKFSGLPLAHDQLILFYINQLIESRELAFSGAPDRCFVILESPSRPTLSAKYISPPEFIVKFAIKSLNEEGGSTQKSICSNILANFGELPWAPRKFLFFFINRLVQKGELGPGAGPGRYVLVPQSLGPKGPVAQEGPNKAEEEGKDVVESTGGGNDSGSGGGGGGGGSDPKPKRGRGRPRKERPNASESSQSDPKPKRGRGRPRLKRPNASESSQSDPKPKRGRGRPPQKRPNASESSQSGMAQEAQDAPRPTQPVRPPPQLNLGPNEYILALPAVAAASVEVNPPGSSSVPANK